MVRVLEPRRRRDAVTRDVGVAADAARTGDRREPPGAQQPDAR